MNDLLLLILFLLLLAFLMRVDFIYYVVYVCAGIYVWSRWVSPRILNSLEVNRLFDDHAFLGEAVKITVVLRNRGRLPIHWIQLAESVPVALNASQLGRRVLRIGARQTKRLTYDIRAMRRGYYRIGPMQLTSGDLFGFKDVRAAIPADYLTVYPRIIPLAQLGLPSRLPFGTLPSRQRLFEDPARPIGVRNYRSGDSPRHINWKVSAHKEELLVRTFQPAISLDTAVVVNLNQEEYSRRYKFDGPEWAIVVAASLAAHLVGLRQSVGLATNGADPLYNSDSQKRSPLSFDEESGRLQMKAGEIPLHQGPSITGTAARMVSPPIPPRSGRAHLMKLLERLARIEPAHTVAFDAWLPGACLDLSWGVTILAITATGNEMICQALHRLLKSGFNPVLIVVEPYQEFGQTRERARNLGFQAYHIFDRPSLDTHFSSTSRPSS
jgi:uncharacterized protein (DUF58 family)